MRKYKDLKIWTRSMKLVTLIYEESRNLPDNEKYGLTSQIRRSAVSIPSNIAEGCSRSSNKELVRFLEISLGSAFELETQLLITVETGMLSSQKVESIIVELNEIQRMISAFRSSIKYDR
jgi:four helix bundle protein